MSESLDKRGHGTRRPTGASANAEAGFTLLELLIAFIVLALLAGFASPLFSRAPSHREAKSVAQDIATHLNLTRATAIRSARDVPFILDLEGRAYRLGESGATTSLPDDVTLELRTAKSEQIDTLSGAIRFFPDGSSTGGHVELTQGNYRFTVIVDWMTGRVSVIE